MVNTDQHKSQSHPRLTILAIGLMILFGAIIIFLDRNEVKQLIGKGELRYLGVAMGFIALSYLFESASTVVMSRVFGVTLDKVYLLKLGFVSSILSNLIALPASLALRLLVLGHHGVTKSQTMGASLLLAYFKNFVFFSLIPVSLVYVIFTYPLVFGGVATMVLIIILLTIAIVTATAVVSNRRARSSILRITGRVWYRLTRKNIETPLNNFGNSLTQGFTRLKQKPKFGLMLAGLVAGDVAAMITGLFFCFKALGIPVHLGVLITGFNFGITLTVISFIPGDIGVQEVSIAGILAIFGVPLSHGILGAILFRVLYYFVPFGFSLGFYWSLLREMHIKTKDIIN